MKNDKPSVSDLVMRELADIVERNTLELAAKMCESHHETLRLVGKSGNYPGEYASEHDLGYGSACIDCADSIRSLIKAQ